MAAGSSPRPPVRPADIERLLRTVVPGRAGRDGAPGGGNMEDERLHRYANFPGLRVWDEVYPGILLGGRSVAKDLSQLKALGVTHVLNAAEGHNFAKVATDATFYRPCGITYLGIKADDNPNFKMAPYFAQAVDYITQAKASGGKVYVHCYHGISRSATLVLAYLVSRERMSLPQAVTWLRQVRLIYPNEGFLQELCDFSNFINAKRSE